MEAIEPELIRRAIDGDDGAFSRWAEGHWPRWVAMARSVVGEEAAEDAVQDALLHAWTRLAQLRAPESAAAWVTRILLRLCLGRRPRWRRPTLDEVPEASYHESPDGRLDVERLLGRLARRQRAVLHLTVVEGMTDSEIAEMLGITAASVRSHRRRARQSLDRWLRAEPGDGP